jgi:F-type H+-transporting ATPase subunit delta
MSNFVISTRYANALMDISEENNSFEQVVQDITFISNTLESSKELRNVLVSPIISSEKKSDILMELFSSSVSDEVLNFLKFLVLKCRENILFEITKRFLSLSDEKIGRVKVDITSAVDLDESQKSKIKNKLEEMINKKVIPNYKIDNSIIGGFKARFNDTVIDATVQHQLELLKKKLFEQDYLNN